MSNLLFIRICPVCDSNLATRFDECPQCVSDSMTRTLEDLSKEAGTGPRRTTPRRKAIRTTTAANCETFPQNAA
jgi:hypothetical protein